MMRERNTVSQGEVKPCDREQPVGNAYGYFNPEGTEFIVTNPKTPRAFDNFLWNEALFANVQQTGVGYSDYQVGNEEAVQLLTGVGRICDFDVFGRDHLMSRLFYIRDRISNEYWTVNGEPVWHKLDAFECRHGLGYTIITSVSSGIEAAFRIFVPHGNDPVELWTLKLTNRDASTRRLSVFSYNQFQFKFKWGFDSYGDMIFRSSVFCTEQNAVVASKHPHRRPHNHLLGFLTADQPIVAFDGTRDAFVGQYNTLQNPEAVVRGFCSDTPGSADATIGAAQFHLELAPGESKEINLILGATDTVDQITSFRVKYFGKFEDYFSDLTTAKASLLALNRVQTPDNHFNRMLNGWIRHATHYGATWCRWGWNGYRDIVQHGLGVVTFAPERTRAILLEALRYQFRSGLALRGWNPVDEKPYSDSALWLVFTLCAYLKETGNFKLLDEVVPFYDGGSATVRQHIDRALDFLENNKGSHGLILIKFGDWNDSLTAVGREGRGESVWLSEAYAEAMRQMVELAAFLKNHLDEANYRARYDSIKTAINQHAWDGEWFVRCFDDCGEPVGSKKNTQGQIFIEAQAWALIAGIADESRREQLIRSCDTKLLTGMGYALLSPSFHRPDDRIGRISCIEPGTCENGTIYSHTNIWMILGLLKCGQSDKAYELLRRILPGYYSGAPDDPKRECLPYVPANCYFGPDHRNNPFQMEFTWVTGSVAWFNHVLLQYVIGARAEFEGLRIDPQLPSGWKECRLERNFRGAVYQITLRNPHGLQSGRIEVHLDGRLTTGNLLPPPESGKQYSVIATLHPNSP
jgi:cellobiose phosphorylase